MQKKIVSVTSFIMLIIFIAISFAPISFNFSRGYKFNGDPYVHCSMWKIATGLAFFVTIFVVVGIVALIMKSIEMNNVFSKIGCFAPALAFVLFGVLWIKTLDYDTHYHSAWGIFVECILLLVASALSILIGLNFFKNKPVNVSVAKNATIPQTPPNSVADELAKYKNLLDSGAITQDEYDAKKSQLLRL